jgi:hypothetical protein
MRIGLVASLVVVVTACTPSQMQLDADNARALARANARIAATGAAFTPAAVAVDVTTSEHHTPGREGELATLVGYDGAHGLRESEALVALRGTGELVFIGGFCALSGHCGRCARQVEYRYFHAPNGSVIVVRPHAVDEVVATRNDSSCSALCAGGTPEARAMDDTTYGARLGITSIDRFELRDEPYVVKIIDRVCTNTVPIP